MDTRKISDVISYLKVCKFIFSDRQKTLKFKIKHELFDKDLEDMIRSLSTTDVIRGPVSDEDVRKIGCVYIFKKNFVGLPLCYIKIRVENDQTPTYVISIHEDEII